MNFIASEEASAYICNSADFAECLSWEYTRSYTDVRQFIHIRNYQEVFGNELGTDLYIHFYGYEGTTVTVQAETVMILSESSTYELQSSTNLFGLEVRCDLASYNISVSDSTLTLCQSNVAHPLTAAQCTKMYQGATQYTIN